MNIPLNEYDFLKRALAVYGEKEAVICGAHRLTYNQVADRVHRWSNAMTGLGLQKGDRVGILSKNCHRVIDAFYGAPLNGLVAMPMNFRLLSSDFEYILNHGKAKALVVQSGLEHLIEPIRAQLSSVEHFILASDDVSEDTPSWLDYESLLSNTSPEKPKEIRCEEDELTALLYTSGTTGRPKGVMLTHRNLYLNAINALIEFGLQDKDVFLQSTAQFHCNGWGMPYATTAVGGTQVILDNFDPAIVCNLIKKEKVTVSCMAPTMLSMLLNHPELDSQALQRNLRIGTAGSAPPMAVIKELQHRLGWEVIQVYGLTETSPFLTVSKLKPHMTDWDEDKKCRVQTRSGYPMIGVDLKVVDDQGNEVPNDGVATGEVLARSNVVMEGYWEQPEATAAAIVDGWFHTGDVATIDKEGAIEVVDRSKDLIISGAENISSIEVEGVLYQHASVLEAAVIAVPNERWGEVPKAYVVLKQSCAISEDELITFCRDRLAHFKCPKSVDFVEELPRTATGKIQKRRLREEHWKDKPKQV
jgi:fatty-acyl-CoA synthase